jgi:hypothetical protein
MVVKRIFYACFALYPLMTWGQEFEAKVKLVNFSSDHVKKIHHAITLIKKVILSEDFKQRVITHSVNGKKTFVDNKGMSNEEIYRIILEGSELVSPEKNGRMDIELELYEQDNTTIGYTYPDTGRIWINQKYFQRYTPVQVADNLFHEWLHKLGFDHSVKYNTKRNFSVPYALGYLMEELAAKHYIPQP